jgi:hypothetical protein
MGCRSDSLRGGQMTRGSHQIWEQEAECSLSEQIPKLGVNDSGTKVTLLVVTSVNPLPPFPAHNKITPLMTRTGHSINVKFCCTNLGLSGRSTL